MSIGLYSFFLFILTTASTWLKLLDPFEQLEREFNWDKARSFQFKIFMISFKISYYQCGIGLYFKDIFHSFLILGQHSFDLAKLLGPFEQLEREFNWDN